MFEYERDLMELRLYLADKIKLSEKEIKDLTKAMPLIKEELAARTKRKEMFTEYVRENGFSEECLGLFSTVCKWIQFKGSEYIIYAALFRDKFYDLVKKHNDAELSKLLGESQEVRQMVMGLFLMVDKGEGFRKTLDPVRLGLITYHVGIEPQIAALSSVDSLVEKLNTEIPWLKIEQYTPEDAIELQIKMQNIGTFYARLFEQDPTGFAALEESVRVAKGGITTLPNIGYDLDPRQIKAFFYLGVDSAQAAYGMATHHILRELKGS